MPHDANRGERVGLEIVDTTRCKGTKSKQEETLKGETQVNHGWGGWLLRLVGSALLIIIILIFGVLLIKILITICMKKCCAVSPLTQAIAIINSELAEEDIKERETSMALVRAP